MEAEKYWLLAAVAIVVFAGGCTKQQSQIDVAKRGLLGGWPEEVAVDVESVDSGAEIDGVRREEIQMLVGKMLNEMGVRVVQANGKSGLNRFIIDVKLEKNPQDGLCRYITNVEFLKVKSQPDYSGRCSVSVGPGEVQIANHEGVSKEELSKAVRQDLALQLLGIWMLLFGPERLDNLSEATLMDLFGEPSERFNLYSPVRESNRPRLESKQRMKTISKSQPH